MKRLALLILAILTPLGNLQAQTETPTLPYCATPGPTATPTHTYQDKVLGYAPAAYWPMTETAGTIAIDATGNGHHATYSGVTLNGTTFSNGNPAPTFDGVNDFVNLYAAINGTFSGSEGTIAGWAKADATVWSDGANNRVVNIQATSALWISSISGGSNLYAQYVSASANTSNPGTDWFHWAISYSATGSSVGIYINGAPIYTSSTVPTWTGALASSTNVLGASNTSGSAAWLGSIAHVAMWTSALNGTQIADLYVVPAIAPTPSPTPICQVYNPTPTPTPDVYINFTTPGGADARIAREISIGDYALFFVVLSIPVSLWIMYGINRLKGGR